MVEYNHNKVNLLVRSGVTNPVIPAGGSLTVVVSLDGFTRLIPIVRQTYAATAATTGVTATVQEAIDNTGDTDLLLFGSPAAVAGISAPTPSQGTQQQKLDKLTALDCVGSLGKQKYVFTNTDAANPCTLDFWGDAN